MIIDRNSPKTKKNIRQIFVKIFLKNEYTPLTNLLPSHSSKKLLLSQSHNN